MLKEHLVMLQGSIEQFTNTGTLFPSSTWAAKALTEPMLSKNSPVNIIEVGAGTGAITVEIIKQMKPGDYLTVVELNSKFMSALKKAVSKVPEYILHADRIEFFEGPVQSLPQNHKYDFIICALPFLNFPSDLTKSILSKFNQLASDDCVMTHFEYMGLGKINRAISKERKTRIDNLRGYLTSNTNAKILDRKNVWRNLLPIYVYTTKLPFLGINGH